ncbi:hypothetical protein DFH09DRAFT_1096059 [Mycena vulgaris]|nr:hypothetical protein DFH09DRAFT_1096059 [Mycena vulgaris]
MKIAEIIDRTGIKAVDDLLFASRDALLGYRNGVTSAVTALSLRGFLSGLSTVFSTVAAHNLMSGVMIQEVAALHVALSLSSGISVMRFTVIWCSGSRPLSRNADHPSLILQQSHWSIGSGASDSSAIHVKPHACRGCESAPSVTCVAAQCWRTAVMRLVWPHTDWPTTKIASEKYIFSLSCVEAPGELFGG